MDLNYTLKLGQYKHATIRIDNTLKITVTAPLFYSSKDIEILLTNKKNWIDKTLTRLSSRIVTKITTGLDEILYLGEIYKFVQTIGMKKEIMIDNIRKNIYSSINLNDEKNILKFYSSQAKFIIIDRVTRLAKIHAITITKTNIRRTVSRYGSCSSNGVISLSERLIMTPLSVIDAIILHELTHIKIMNHSDQFYNELYRLCPNYKDADKWLKEKMPIKYPPEKNL